MVTGLGQHFLLTRRLEVLDGGTWYCRVQDVLKVLSEVELGVESDA